MSVVNRGLRGFWLAGLALLCGLAVVLPPAQPASAATDEEDACFILASYRVFWNMEASFEAFAHWLDLFDLGEPYSVLPEYLASQEPWLNKTVDDLYLAALDRTPDDAGRGYWAGRLESGVLINAFGSQIYGSAEFYRRSGSTPEDFIRQLYARILHRSPSTSEVAYWTGKLRSSSRGDVAWAFFSSPESRADRVSALYQRLLGRPSDSAGLAYWKNQLLRVNDVRLAVNLASTPEYFRRTTTPSGECLGS